MHVLGTEGTEAEPCVEGLEWRVLQVLPKKTWMALSIQLAEHCL